MRLTPVLLAAGAGALGAAASAHPQPLDVSPAHTAHSLEARSPLSLSVGGINLCIGLFCHRPSRNWKCSGSGRDGYSVDYNGNSRPSWAPSGFLWFGADIGWAPPKGFSCGTSWEIPSALHGQLGLVTWWKPPSAWLNAHVGVDLGFKAPSFWGFILAPSSSWTCSGNGKDGFSVDIHGNGRPSWVPAGWLWFGGKIGWAPPVGWSRSSSFEFPSAFIDVAHLVTWWKPSSAWLDAHVGIDLGFKAPSFWGFVLAPSSSWTCSGNGKDGFSVDIHGNGRPSWVPAGWLWFGGKIGWAPPVGWSCSSSFEFPSAFIDVAHLVTWWKPSSGWLDAHVGIDLGFKAPSFWGFILAPSSSWTCSGNGKDGFSVDIHGNGRPSWVPAGWLWFGGKIGWAPPVGWSCSSSFEFPSAFIDVAHLVTWWKPSSGWLDAHVGIDLGFKAPSFWGFILAPSSSWTCSGNGKDGFSVDIHGNGRPSWVPAGWLWFGGKIGWAPPVGWSCSSSFELPGAFIEILHLVTWWKPSNAWIDAHAGVGLSFTPPPWWGIAVTPSKSWKCNGGGRDGYPVDSNGQAPPSWVPSGWAWFGSSVGWQPVAGWSGGSTWAIPSQWRKTCSKATWWTPPSTWLTKHQNHDFGFSLPIHWGVDSCGCSCGCGAGDVGITTTSRAPASASTARTTTTARATSSATTSKAATTSKKPATTSSSKPASTTSKKPAASTSTSTSTSTSHKPAATTSSKPAASTTSKKPSTPTSKPVTTSKAGTTKTVTYIGDASTVTIPGDIVTVTRTVSISQPKPTSTPSQGWQCDGSGKDGYDVDWQGNGRPSHYPSGWLWWGTAIGWAPSASWSCSSSWQPSSQQITVIISSQISWWLPPASFELPSSVNCPAHWTSQGWIDTRIPSASWQCSGSGEDGYDFDHEGHGRPSGAALGFKWFGRAHGWQPCKGFQLPSASWSPPSWWLAHRAVWWRPTSRWNLRHSFKCPTFWRSSRGHLRGSWVWH
ncbi:hypothetical protein JCM8208_001217 [Rhodotorula glutinis]